MKLTDILRQINEEEENGLKNAPKEEYNFSIVPSDMGKALDALSDPENYVVKTTDKEGNEKIETDFTSNFNDEAIITKVFGSRNPSDRDKDAMNNWNSLSPVGRRSKIKDIQKRIPEIYKKGIEQKDFIKAYDAWKNEGNEGSEEDFIVANDYKPGSEFAPIKKVSKAGTLTKYFPDKTKDNMRKYGGTLSIDTHYDVDGDKIIFPSEKNPFKTQSLLKSRIGTIMDNAGVTYSEKKISQSDTGTTTPKTTQTNTPKTIPATFKITLDPKKVRGNTNAVKNMIAGLKNTYDKNFDYSKNVLTISNIKPEKKIDLIQFFAPYKQTELNEEADWEMRRMLVRAGIIK
jgi:uncharacterized protein YktA (UPF0223 family)